MLLAMVVGDMISMSSLQVDSCVSTWDAWMVVLNAESSCLATFPRLMPVGSCDSTCGI